MLEYLPVDVICFEKRTVLRKRSARKTVSFEDIFFAARAVFEIREYHSDIPQF